MAASHHLDSEPLYQTYCQGQSLQVGCLEVFSDMGEGSGIYPSAIHCVFLGAVKEYFRDQDVPCTW